MRDEFRAQRRCNVGPHRSAFRGDRGRPFVVDTVTEHGAYGLTIHLASRLPTKADPGEICLTDETYRLVRSFCDVGPLGRHRLRGMPEPIELYLLKTSSRRLRASNSAASRWPSFVGAIGKWPCCSGLWRR